MCGGLGREAATGPRAFGAAARRSASEPPSAAGLPHGLRPRAARVGGSIRNAPLSHACGVPALLMRMPPPVSNRPQSVRRAPGCLGSVNVPCRGLSARKQRQGPRGSPSGRSGVPAARRAGVSRPTRWPRRLSTSGRNGRIVTSDTSRLQANAPRYRRCNFRGAFSCRRRRPARSALGNNGSYAYLHMDEKKSIGRPIDESFPSDKQSGARRRRAIVARSDGDDGRELYPEN